MKPAMNPVSTVMSRLPVEVERATPLGEAARAMAKAGVRHVPVLKGYRLFGVLSRHDVQRRQIEQPADWASMACGEACTRDVLTVDPATPFAVVAGRMLERRVGSALVTDGGLVVGIVTTTDALRVLAEMGPPGRGSPSRA